MAIPLGRWFGIHLRVHLSFLLLLALAAGYSVALTGSTLRGVGLWLTLCAAVAVREVARALAATYAGVPLRALFLLPFGGVMALEPRQGTLSPASRRLVALSGAVANFAAALLLIGFTLGIDPAVSLFRQPWIAIEHILRSAVWLQVMMGVINLLPSRGLRTPKWMAQRLKAEPKPVADDSKETPAPSPVGRSRPAFGVGTAMALALFVLGIYLSMLLPVLLAMTILFIQYVGRISTVGGADGAGLRVRDVMLTEYTPLPASGTLGDALRRTTHTLQETFPVVRGDRLVGWISRGTLIRKLQIEGDGYLQGAMVRSLQIADPEEKLADTLRRVAAMGASEFVPVVEDGAMVGMLTPGSLERAVGQIRLTQPAPERGEA